MRYDRTIQVLDRSILISIVLFFHISSSAQTDTSIHKSSLSFEFGYSRHLAEPMNILSTKGGSPGFIPRWRPGRGIFFMAGISIFRSSWIMGLVTMDQIPFAYELYVSAADHPGTNLVNDVRTGKSTHKLDRTSIGIAYRYSKVLYKKIGIEFEIGIQRNTTTTYLDYRLGIGVETDTGSVWVLGLKANIFEGSSNWQIKPGLRFNYTIAHDHRINLGYYLNHPLSPILSKGEVILVGNSPLRTTHLIQQSGILHGIYLSYVYILNIPK